MAHLHSPILAEISAQLAGHGLCARGGLLRRSTDDLPPHVQSIVLIGNVGADMWQPFFDAQKPGEHPMDEWTSSVLTPIAREFGADVVFPFSGPPYYSFQRWAERAEALNQSPIGPMIHPEFGLWHAYRGAFLFDADLGFAEPQPQSSPCASCAEKPCVPSCPVSAFESGTYDVKSCRTYVASADGTVCREQGCQARQACPVGASYQYPTAQQAYHMVHFLKSSIG